VLVAIEATDVLFAADSLPAIFAVTAEKVPVDSEAVASAVAVRRVPMPMYQRSSPISSTIDEVKNISGKRSING
jgi:predicted tellurium resistance membrane protein TerC